MERSIFPLLKWLDRLGKDTCSKAEIIGAWGEAKLQLAISEGLCTVSEPYPLLVNGEPVIKQAVVLTNKGLKALFDFQRI